MHPVNMIPVTLMMQVEHYSFPQLTSVLVLREGAPIRTVEAASADTDHRVYLKPSIYCCMIYSTILNHIVYSNEEMQHVHTKPLFTQRSCNSAVKTPLNGPFGILDGIPARRVALKRPVRVVPLCRPAFYTPKRLCCRQRQRCRRFSTEQWGV